MIALDNECDSCCQDRGVVYLCCGERYANALLVSLWSLRNFYDGGVTVYCDEKTLVGIAPLAAPLGADLQLLRFSFTNPRYFYFVKTLINMASPYKKTLFLDVDTLVLEDPTEIFEHEMAFTQQWYYGAPLYLNSKCFPAKRRRRQMKLVMRYSDDIDLIHDAEDALHSSKPIPAVNTGVYLFTDLPKLMQTMPIAYGKLIDIVSSDETVLTLLWNRLVRDNVTVLDDSWNRIDMAEGMAGAKILHFCDRTWRKSRLWQTAFRDACSFLSDLTAIHKSP